MPMRYGEKLSEFLPVIGRIKPQAITAAATANSDVIDMSYFTRVMVIFNMGDYAGGNDGSVAVAVYGDTASNGSFATAITGKALTAANFTGSTLDDAVGIIEFTADDVTAQSLRYARISVTPSDQNLTASVVIIGYHSDYQPGSDYDLAKVKQIVS